MALSCPSNIEHKKITLWQIRRKEIFGRVTSYRSVSIGMHILQGCLADEDPLVEDMALIDKALALRSRERPPAAPT